MDYANGSVVDHSHGYTTYEKCAWGVVCPPQYVVNLHVLFLDTDAKDPLNVYDVQARTQDGTHNKPYEYKE